MNHQSAFRLPRFLAILFCTATTLLATAFSQSVGHVNGKAIDAAEFTRRVSQIVNSQREYTPEASIDLVTIRMGVWDQMVEEMLVQEALDSVGIHYTDEQLQTMLVNSPPEYLRDQFRDTSGEFDEALFRRFMADPRGVLAEYGNSPEEIDKIMVQFQQIQNDFRTETLRRELRDSVARAFRLTRDDAYNAYRQEYSMISGSYAVLSSELVNDYDVEVTEEEARQYYDAHRSSYQQPASREVIYAIFPPAPSAQDSSAVIQTMTAMRNRLQAAPGSDERNEIFDEMVAQYGAGSMDHYENISLQGFSPEVQTQVLAARPGSIIGPVWLYDGAHLFVVTDMDDKGEQAVKIQQIQLMQTYEQTDKALLAQARKIVQQAKSGTSFDQLVRQYSTDYGSAENGGNLGYIYKGTIEETVENASFKAKPGAILGPLKTEYGYYVIKVLDRTTRQVSLRDVAIVPHVGPQTLDQIKTAAREFRNRLAPGSDIQSSEPSDNYLLYVSGPVKRNQAISGSMKLAKFTYSGHLGDISDVIELADGTQLVGQISTIHEAGTAPFEEVQESIMSRLRTEKKLDQLQERASKLRAQVTSGKSLHALPQKDQLVEVYDFEDLLPYSSLPGVGSDSLLMVSLFSQSVGKVSPVIRGEQGYYIALVDRSTIPSMDDFLNDTDGYVDRWTEDRRNTLFLDWLASRREQAELSEE